METIAQFFLKNN